jgi:hypothetical protein
MNQSIFAAAQEVVNLESELEKAFSQNEEKVCDCYHILELPNLNAVQIMKTTKVLREALMIRRELKEERTRVQMIVTHCRAILEKNAEHVKRSAARLAKYDAEAREALKKIMEE